MNRITEYDKENQKYYCVTNDEQGLFRTDEVVIAKHNEKPVMSFTSYRMRGKLIDKIAAYEDEIEITREFIAENKLLDKLLEFKKEKELPKMLPCPFCGETPQLFEMPQWDRKEKEDKYGIRCVGKDCHFHPCTPYGTKEKIIKIWNERWE